MTPARRGLTIGLVLTITLVAFEALAVITILPAIKDDLQGIRLYGWVTSASWSRAARPTGAARPRRSWPGCWCS